MPNAPQPADNPQGNLGQDAQNEPQNEANQQVPPVPGSLPAGGITSDVGSLYGNQFNSKEINFGKEINFNGGLGEILGISMAMANPTAANDAIQRLFASASGDLLRGIFPRGAAATQSPQRPAEMPETEGKFEEWFCGTLTPYERCYVRATAILHGAPARLITIAARQLDETFHRPARTPTAGSASSTIDGNAPTSNQKLTANTFTEVRKEDDARRLYWQDSDSNGSSEFGLMALQLIAREIEGTGGMLGQNSEAIIEQWATSSETEHSWRAAHALGVIWWTIDQGHLTSVSSGWAVAELALKRNSAAGLIFGAYETESDRGAKTAPELKTISLLSRLGEEARQSGSADKARSLSHVVTTAYELIALVSIETALDGLDRLLGLSYQGEGSATFSMTLAVFIYGALSYYSLACQGQVREILTRLARHAERLTRLRFGTKQLSKSLLDRCELELEIVFFIFFFLVASSFPGADAKRYAHYGKQDTLDAEPEIPGASGCDTVLASIFAEKETAMRQALVTLLCAALVNGKTKPENDKARPAMETLERWTNHLFPAMPTTEPEQLMWTQYRRFVMLVGSQCSNWDGEFNQTGFRAGLTWFRNALNHWPQKKPSGQLAHEVLGRLGL